MDSQHAKYRKKPDRSHSLSRFFDILLKIYSIVILIIGPLLTIVGNDLSISGTAQLTFAYEFNHQ